jgi:hypothetical protein
MANPHPREPAGNAEVRNAHVWECLKRHQGTRSVRRIDWLSCQGDGTGRAQDDHTSTAVVDWSPASRVCGGVRENDFPASEPQSFKPRHRLRCRPVYPRRLDGRQAREGRASPMGTFQGLPVARQRSAEWRVALEPRLARRWLPRRRPRCGSRKLNYGYGDLVPLEP